MNEATAIHMATQAMVVTAKIAAPILAASLVVGLTISIFQSITQIQEFTLTFVPKLLAIAVVVVVAGHWMIGQFIGYTSSLFQQLPHLLSAG